MNNIVEFPTPETYRSQPEIVGKVGDTLLEFMQEARGLPYHAPTVQVKVLRRGSYAEFEPVNPLAKLFAKLVGRQVLTEGNLAIIEQMGMAVERR